MGLLAGGTVDAFEQWERRRNLSRRTITDRRRRLDSLASHIGGDLFDVTTDDIEAWLDTPRPPLTPPSRYTYITEVNAFFRWAVREGFLLSNPCDRVVRPRLPRRTPRPLAPDDVAHLLEQADTPRLAVWVALCGFAGLRVSEVAALQVPEVDFDRGKVFVAGGKGDKDRLVPMHDEVRRALQRLPMPRSGYVTPKEDGSRYEGNTISGYVSRHMKACSIPGVPHQLRHYFITEVVEHGDLLTGKEAAGHASIETTAGYAAYSRTRLDRAVLAVGSTNCGGCPLDGKECPAGKV